MLEYKRLQSTDVIKYNTEGENLSASEVFNSIFNFGRSVDEAVSYTHLTLPTILLV